MRKRLLGWLGGGLLAAAGLSPALACPFHMQTSADSGAAQQTAQAQQPPAEGSTTQ